MNGQATQLLGYSPETVQAMGSDLFLTIMHPDDLARVPALLEQIQTLPDNQPMETEYRLRHASGEWRWVSDRSVVFSRSAEGKPLQMLGCVLDITERKQIESDLNQAHERYQLAMAAINGMVYDYDILQNRVERSEGLMEIVGYAPSEVPETAEWWSQQIHPEDLQKLQAYGTEAMRSWKRTHFEYRVRHKQGHYVHVMDQAVILRDQAGQAIRLVGSTTDITDRKQMEESLRQSETRLRRLFDSNVIGIVEANLDCITVANDAFLQLIGYDRNEFTARQLHWQEFTPPEYQELDQRGIDELIATGICTPFEKEFIRKDGRRIPILIGAAMVEHEPLTWICFILDLSERKLLEQERAELLSREQAARHQAEAASRTKDEFLAIVSHELRSPLNSILGWSRLLRTRKLDAATIERALETIERNAQVQTQLIEDLLDISRIIRGKIRLNLRPTRLASIVQVAVDAARPTATSKDLQLETHFDPQIDLIAGDPERLQQIIWNLLSNAIKFTPEGGRVEVKLESCEVSVLSSQFKDSAHNSQLTTHNPNPTTHNSQRYAQITITDTGKGISPDFLPHLFERFRQADSGTTRTQTGLGLGLAIVRSLVELHGGTIQADSPGAGMGATFTVTLPLLDITDAAQAPDAEPILPLPASEDSLKGLRVLVVDDEADTREMMTMALQQFGATVITAGSSQEAFSLFQTTDLDVLLSDVGMPGEDGYGLIRRIRSLPAEAGGNIPAAAITAYVRDYDRAQALASGFQMHLAKPIEPAQLLKVVLTLASNRSRPV